MNLEELLNNLLEQLQSSGIDPVSYQYFHQLFDKRTIIFNQDVSENLIETVYLPLKEFEEDSSTEPITLILNSLGGSVSNGFFLAHYIANYKKKLNIIVTGYAASMAAVILCGGGKNDNVTRYCYPSTYALIHDGYIALQASEAKTASDIMAFNEKVDDDIRDFMLKNTNITAEQYDAKTRHQWFLSAKEMKELNLIDIIIGE
jgi:ATP-dependent Clp protease protease subunit